MRIRNKPQYPNAITSDMKSDLLNLRGIKIRSDFEAKTRSDFEAKTSCTRVDLDNTVGLQQFIERRFMI